MRETQPRTFQEEAMTATVTVSCNTFGTFGSCGDCGAEDGEQCFEWCTRQTV